MTIRVTNREDPEISAIYENVREVRDTNSDTGLWCRQLVLENDETATYPPQDWKFEKLGWVSL